MQIITYITIPESYDRTNCESVVLYNLVSVVVWVVGIISDSERKFILRFKSVLADDVSVDFNGMLSVKIAKIYLKK
jgi:hypothetical protein